MQLPVELNDTRTIKTLGIHWQPCSDVLQFSNATNKIFQPTKRTMLSQIASIFDPIGLLAPIVIKAKMVPRRVIGMRNASRIYLHGYSDASERAMGACVYIRAADECGNTSSHLLCAKSKTAPIGNGRTTLPRLELCAAVILARLMANVMAAISLPFHEIRAHSDSTVALAWIYGGASRYYRKLQLILCITARMLRFRYRELRTTNRLAPQEIDNAMQVYVRHVQSQHYWKEINQLETNREVNNSSSLRQLKPFLDGNHLLRVGGRLQLSDFNYDTKDPILLPRHSALTALILHHEHHEQLHCGPQSLLAAVRRRFWIVRGTTAARKICRACVECVRVRPVPLRQLMGQLPADHLEPNPPFSITGIDYAGPINIINRRMRGAVSSKGYIALFICFSTRAVHIEAVSDLSTSAFIAAFTRFSSRYGLPSKIYSDNATNLRGAARKYRELHQQINATELDDKVSDFFSDKSIEWMFIPARSPHHGGLCEAGVKVVKAFLGRVGGDARFTFEELSTVLAQVAACMNSRPISPLSDDPNDPQPLTPAHFLIGRPLNNVPEINQLERRIGSLNRWEYVQRVAQQFRARWQTEYVLALQHMTKWQRPEPNVSVGDFVLLVADNEKPTMGRIVDTFPGSDDYVRVVAIRTPNGIVRRDVRRIRRIPLEDDEYVTGRNEA
ncbi:uncharacterized protein LOC135710060 [Ochlerotatus camptorhynchus]|uniref:uncharacterized protein LOC135710060 n=1 Tax=Ochlerotatus camptorhynchus TaxID=644619 RepID=UPI0031D0E385